MYKPSSRNKGSQGADEATEPSLSKPAKQGKRSRKGEAAFASPEDYADVIARNLARAERDSGMAAPAAAPGAADREAGDDGRMGSGKGLGKSRRQKGPGVAGQGPEGVKLRPAVGKKQKQGRELGKAKSNGKGKHAKKLKRRPD